MILREGDSLHIPSNTSMWNNSDEKAVVNWTVKQP